MRAILYRLESEDQGTFGRMVIPGLTLYSGELPWRNNEPSNSCIPPGIYQVEWTHSPRFKRFMFELKAVPKRSSIRIHPANLMGDASLGLKSQLNGCIALGEKLGWISGQKALLLSTPAMRKFESVMERKAFDLEIINYA